VNKRSFLQANILLIITAVIWGFAFVAQRAGMSYIGPFTFNAIRFALGGFSLFPILLLQKNEKTVDEINQKKPPKLWWLIIGFVLFAGASLQQVGLVYTTAGNAGFITGMYVVFVPLLALLYGKKTHSLIWIAVAINISGLYLLCIKDDFSFSFGDLFELAGALCWAIHVLIVSNYSKKINPILVAQQQFFVCALLSFMTALAFEKISWNSIVECAIPLLYGSFLSVGVAFTLQIVAQKKAHPTHAAIILSTEAMFAAIGGWFILNEVLSIKGIIGCGLMLSGMVLAQFSSGNDSIFENEKKLSNEKF